MKKVGTVALVVNTHGESPVLVEALSDDREIGILEKGMDQGDGNPLALIYDLRERQEKEDEEFGDYVEELLSQPFLKPEIQDQGVQWLRSKIKIEEYQKSESDATRIIASYAYQIYQEDRARKDFTLASPNAKVRIRVFELSAIRAADPGVKRAA
ncbi:MAG: hypothetical protein AB7P04_09855 [Bacteriovoracia bacterium]